MRIALIGLLAVLFAACGSEGGSDSDGPTTGREALEQREDDLRQTVDDAVRSFLAGDTDAFYNHFSSDFQSRCELKDFQKILGLAALFLGDVSDRIEKIEITEVRYEEDRAFVTTRIDLEGMEPAESENEGDFADFWVLEDGEWKADTEEPNPCDLGEGLFGGAATVTIGDGSDDDDAPSGPGTSRTSAVGIGESVTTGDLRVTVLAVNDDAFDALRVEDELVEPPAAANRYVLVTVRVEHVGDGDETISVASSDFELTGSRNLIYGTFENDCDFFFGQIQGEMFPGGSLEGDVCFEAPLDESDLILIANPFVSFDDDGRRYLALE